MQRPQLPEDLLGRVCAFVTWLTRICLLMFVYNICRSGENTIFAVSWFLSFGGKLGDKRDQRRAANWISGWLFDFSSLHGEMNLKHMWFTLTKNSFNNWDNISRELKWLSLVTSSFQTISLHCWPTFILSCSSRSCSAGKNVLGVSQKREASAVVMTTVSWVGFFHQVSLWNLCT